jgi:hypothetical protein
MTISLGPQGTLVTGTRTEPVSVKSILETRAVNLRLQCLDERPKFWGPLVSTGNRLLQCPLHCWHVSNECSDKSPLLSDQCSQRALINARYRYIGQPYSNLLPACLLHPGTSQDLSTIRGCILEPARV